MTYDHTMQNTFLFVVFYFDLLLNADSLFNIAFFLFHRSARSVVINENAIAFLKNTEFFNIAVIVIVMMSSS